LPRNKKAERTPPEKEMAELAYKKIINCTNTVELNVNGKTELRNYTQLDGE
jgi:hypothetical protein